MPTLTWEQIKGVGDRLIAMFLTYAVAKGWITPSDVSTYATIFIGLISLAWGYWVNRNKALVQGAATVPGTVVITEPKLAHDTVESNIIPLNQVTVVAPSGMAESIPSPRVVSSAEVEVVSKTA